MAVYLRQSTAVDIGIGPFVDETDGVTALTSLTIAQADVRLKKNNGAWAQVNDDTSATHEENGWYEKELDTTDTNTCGRLLIAVHESGALPVWHEFWVLEEAVYDGFFGASALGYIANAPVNVAQFGGNNLTSTGGRPEVNTTHIAGSVVSTSSAQIGVNVVNAGGTAWNSGAIVANTIATGAIDADALATDAVTEIQSGLATAAALATVDGIVDTIVITTDKLDDTLEDDAGTFRFTENALEQAPTGGSAPTAEEIADEVETRTITAVTTVNGLAANVITAASINADAVTEIQSGLATASALATVDTNVDAILADTGTDGVIVATNNDKTDYTIATGGIATTSFEAGAIDAAAIATNAIGSDQLAASAVDEILDETIGDSTITFRQALRVMLSVLAGKMSGGGTTEVTFRNVADSTNRVVATVDVDGNRTDVTLSV